jgi:hypothetical protein
LGYSIIFFSRTTALTLSKLGINYLSGKGIQVSSKMKRIVILEGEVMVKE